MKKLLDKLYIKNHLSREEIVYLLDNIDEDIYSYVFDMAEKTVKKVYGNRIFIRGLMEFSNYCRNNCIYCGIRKDNKSVNRYRLSKNEIIYCLKDAHNLGYKTFVLQSGLQDLEDINLVITDSQIFKNVDNIVPKHIKLTSFSTLFARYKVDLQKLVNGVKSIESLNNYSLVIHCGGCMVNRKEMGSRIMLCNERQVSITNYRIVLAYLNGILNRTLEIFND